MALLNLGTTLPASSRDALERWEERYNAAKLLAQPGTWVSELGDLSTTGALETKYPMTMLALKYLEAKKSEPSFETIGEKSCDLAISEYQAGIAIEAIKLYTNVFAAAKWDASPAQFVQAEGQFIAKLIADALVANTQTCGWDDLALFHDSHLCKGDDASSATFDNLQASAKDVVSIANIEAEFTLMKEVLDVNGDALGVQPDTIAVPRQKHRGLVNLLKQNLIASAAGTATVTNPFADGTINIVEITPLTDVNDWYIFDSKLIANGAPPWVVAKLSLPSPGFNALSLCYHDETSEMFKRSRKLGVDSRIFFGSKFLYPHAIRKVAGA